MVVEALHGRQDRPAPMDDQFRGERKQVTILEAAPDYQKLNAAIATL
jgi:hypothetical protein